MEKAVVFVLTLGAAYGFATLLTDTIKNLCWLSLRLRILLRKDTPND